MLRRAVPVFLAAALVVAGFTQLDRYNVTWDEALGDLFFGQRYLSYLTSFDARYLDFEHDPYPPGHVPNLSGSVFASKPWEYWPAADILAAATSRIVSGTLHLADPFDGFHAFNLLAAAALLIALYRVVEREESTATALVAVTTLFLMPRVVCDMMANIKDFPEMVFYSATVLAFFGAYERGSLGGIAASGAVWGLALGTKANSWFIPFTIIPYILWRGLGPWRGRERRLIIGLAAAAVIAAAVTLALWPYLWPDPLTRAVYNFDYVRERAGSTASTIDPFFALLVTTPPLVLLLLAAGLVVVVTLAFKRQPFSVLLVLWLGVIAARLPFSANFDGVRHFLEIFPPIAAIAAIGSVAIARRASQRAAQPQPRTALFAALCAVVPAAAAWATAASHPFETAYWNALAGGLRGAQARQLPQSCDYWAASYRLGLDWINANAPKGSVLMVPIAGHTVRLVAPVRLRPDIHLVDYPTGGGPAAAERRLRETRHVAARVPLFVMFIPRPDWATELDVDCVRRLRPARAWTLDGAPVLLVYRYAP